MIDLKDITLGEIITFKNGKKRPSDEGDIPVYGGNGILGYTNINNYENCIAIGRVGAYCGSVYYEPKQCWISDNAICAIPKDGLHIYYALYLLKSLHLNHRHIGTSQPLLTQEILNKIECRIPEFTIQEKIANILQIIDSKIENNNQINRNLSEQVAALYKAWFIDFERNDGVCPEEWKEATLGDIAEIGSGKRPPMKQTDKTDDVCIPLIGAASIMGYTNSVLYDSKILVTGRVGTHGVVQRFNNECWPSDNTLVITTDKYEFVNQILLRIDYKSMNRGSTQPLITQGDLKKTEIILPTDAILDEFEALAGGLMNQYEKNILENAKLSELRDTLLPKLMSGELDVSDMDF